MEIDLELIWVRMTLWWMFGDSESSTMGGGPKATKFHVIYSCPIFLETFPFCPAINCDRSALCGPWTTDKQHWFLQIVFSSNFWSVLEGCYVTWQMTRHDKSNNICFGTTLAANIGHRVTPFCNKVKPTTRPHHFSDYFLMIRHYNLLVICTVLWVANQQKYAIKRK